MKQLIAVLTVALLIPVSIDSESFARGGRGGGRGGGGGFRGGGGGRSPSMSRSRPSVSRPTSRPVSRPSTRPAPRPSTPSRPSIPQRPSTGQRPSVGQRPSTGQRPSVGQRPSTGQRPSVGQRPSTGQRPSAGQRPSNKDLQNFLQLPQGPSTRPSTGNRPSQLPTTRPAPTPGTRPGAGERPATRPAPTPGTRPGAGERPGAGNRPSTRPAPGTRPGTRPTPGQRDQIADRMRDHMHDHWGHGHRPPFHGTWPGHRPIHCPGYHRWWGGHWNQGYWWRWATAGAITGWIAYRWSSPAYYDYGSGGNVYYEGDEVYVNGAPAYTGQEYYDQASQIADVPEITEAQGEQIEWLPLGVFAVTKDNLSDSNMFLQLAVSKEGIIAGTYFNEDTDQTIAVEGKVDKNTQRAAWKFLDDKNKDVVMETGIYNLSEDSTTALVHFGPDTTQTVLLVRLEEPQEETTGSGK